MKLRDKVRKEKKSEKKIKIKMEANSEKQLTYIEKLNGENYSVWSFKIKAYMQEKECWEAISEQKPTEAKKLEEWNKKNQKALNSIILSIANSQIIHIKNSNSAKEAWEQLQEEH